MALILGIMNPPAEEITGSASTNNVQANKKYNMAADGRGWAQKMTGRGCSPSVDTKKHPREGEFAKRPPTGVLAVPGFSRPVPTSARLD